MLKLKMMLCMMMLPLVVVSLHVKAVCQSVRGKPPPPPAWIMRPPRLADTAEQDYFTLRRLITMQKQLEEPRSILMGSADGKFARIDGQLMQLLSNTHALPAEYKCLK